MIGKNRRWKEMSEKADDQINKLRSKAKRRNWELCGLVTVAGVAGIVSLEVISNYVVLGIVCAICALTILMVIFFGYSKRIRPVETEIWELQQQVNGVN